MILSFKRVLLVMLLSMIGLSIVPTTSAEQIFTPTSSRNELDLQNGKRS